MTKDKKHMRYHVLASDYDGTLADQGRVDETTLGKLRQLRATGRKLILVTGREMKDLVIVFPEYAVFDHIVAENGALIHTASTGAEQLLGQAPEAGFVRALEERRIYPLSVGKVIVATWEPNEQAVLEVIKASGSERQLIFNKGAVMILPPGVNKATGLQALLRSLHLSIHNVVAVGDAENDSALLQAAECSVAVGNALASLKEAADWVTDRAHGAGVGELMDRLVSNDLSAVGGQLSRHYLEVGTLKDGRPFAISPYRSGLLLSGISGGGKTTFTLTIVESLVQRGYQFCLIDPEGDYLGLPGAVVMGNETTLPPIEEIRDLLKDPGQSLVICTLSVPLADRPAFFSRLLAALLELRQEYGHPHWLVLDEAHHLIPSPAGMAVDGLPADFNNFILITTSPEALSAETLAKVGMVLTVGDNPAYPIEQFCKVLDIAVPAGIPVLGENEVCIWERDESMSPYPAHYRLPRQLQQRHKKKYAQGDMDYNSFVFTGRQNQLHLVANNLMLFLHISEGIDTDTWMFHLQRKDFTNWFRHSVHDEELARAGEEAEEMNDPAESKKHILGLIAKKYTA
jgi:hydroxymethylpyrimidine pyrophosphatase-like HAD family hydrolase